MTPEVPAAAGIVRKMPWPWTAKIFTTPLRGRVALESQASGTHDQSLQSIMTFDGALYKSGWKNSGSDGVKATEAIGLQGIPALYGEYNALV